MLISRFSTNLKKEELLKMDIIIINPKYVRCKEQLKLAYFLTEESFKNKKNISKNFAIEFLLWFFGTRKISDILKLNDFDPKDFICVHNRELKFKELPLNIPEKCSWEEIEKISLSRI